MTFFAMKQTAAAVLIGLAAASSNAWAGAQDYEFQLVQKEVQKADNAEISVRLVNKQTGKPVPDAVIFERRLDMAPDGMETMTSAIVPLPANEAGVYRFRVKLSMDGGWRVSLAAKVQGETGTVESRLSFRAVP